MYYTIHYTLYTIYYTIGGRAKGILDGIMKRHMKQHATTFLVERATQPCGRGPSATSSRADNPPTTSYCYSLVTKPAVTRGLLTKRVITILLLTGKCGSGLFVVLALRLPVLRIRKLIISESKCVGNLMLTWDFHP